MSNIHDRDVSPEPDHGLTRREALVVGAAAAVGASTRISEARDGVADGRRPVAVASKNGLEAVGRSGSRKQWTGFDVRRALDLPETLFSMHVRTRADGERVVHFLGRGWGHGVGLCQNGAYGLARSGRTFDQILEHYYTGIQIIKWQPSSGLLQSTLR